MATTPHAEQLLEVARRRAISAGAAGPFMSHLVDALLSDSEGNIAAAALFSSGIPSPQCGSDGCALERQVTHTPLDLNQLTQIASAIARSRNQLYVGAEHLLLALLDGPHHADFEQYLATFKVTPAEVRKAIVEILGQ